MLDDQIIVGAALVAILIFSLGLHEMAHAAVAYRCGDDTAKRLGRITPNPIKHIDPFLTVILPALLYFVLPRILGTPPLMFGGAKPVPVVPMNLRHPYRDMMWVALAGPATNFVLAFLSLLALKASLTWFDVAPRDVVAQILVGSAKFNLLLTVFNLLPIPPLDGSRVLTYVLPSRLREPYMSLSFIGIPLVFALVFFVPGGQETLFRWLDALYHWMGSGVEGLFSLVRKG
ncbi:MAG: site-2 protease family protein [Planctomycetota bacterium]